jgi:hypothetical protein
VLRRASFDLTATDDTQAVMDIGDLVIVILAAIVLFHGAPLYAEIVGLVVYFALRQRNHRNSESEER